MFLLMAAEFYNQKDFQLPSSNSFVKWTQELTVIEIGSD